MMRYCWIILALFFIFPSQVYAAFDIEISEPELEISSGFTGDTLTLFGSATPNSDIVILVKGPEKDTVIRRKIQVFSLWIHAESVVFHSVPSYYNIASSSSISMFTDADTRKQYGLGLNSLSFKPSSEITPEKQSRFQEALVQNKQLSGLYSLAPNAVTFVNDQLFRTRIYMPSHVPLGDYTIEAFMFQNGQLIEQKQKPFRIKQVGLTAKVHDFALNDPFWYGICAILLALFSSLLATLLLRRD